MLISPAAHAEFSWLHPTADQVPLRDVAARQGDQPVLLEWMLDNTPLRQLPAVQQRVLSVLCTMAKVCFSAVEANKQLEVAEAYGRIFRTAWHVLARLLPQTGAPTGSQAAAAATGGSSSQDSGSAEQQGATAAATGQTPAGGSSSHAGAALSWLPLLGRCFLQASQQMSRASQQRAAGSAAGSNQQKQDQD